MVSNEYEDQDSLGAWKADELAQTASKFIGAGSDSGLPSDTRFLSGVAKLVRRRLANQATEADPTQPAVFLLKPDVQLDPGIEVSGRAPMLSSGRTMIAGRLWFVNATVASGRYIDFAVDDDENLFQFVTDHLQFGDVPAVVLEPRTKDPHIRYYPNGLNDPDECIEHPITTVDVSLEKVFEAIDTIYTKCLVTPEALSSPAKLWVDSTKGHPAKNAEGLVQGFLQAGLAGAFPTCNIRPEQTAAVGRLDLEIEEPDPSEPGRVIKHAILELKVLRSINSNGNSVPPSDTKDWIEKGVTQAAAYRDNKGALAAALCCFDMRKEHSGDECFEHVKDLAAKLSVSLKNWHIFSNSELYRQHLAVN